MPIRFAPFEFGDQMVVLVSLFGGKIAQAIAGDADYAVGDGKDTPRVFAFGIYQPGVEAAEVFAIEQADSRVPTDRRRRSFARAGHYCRKPEPPRPDRIFRKRNAYCTRGQKRVSVKSEDTFQPIGCFRSAKPRFPPQDFFPPFRQTRPPRVHSLFPQSLRRGATGQGAVSKMNS